MLFSKEKVNSISSKVVKAAVEGVIKIASDNPHLQNQLFREEFPLFLQINAFKIPRGEKAMKRLHRIPLANSPLPADADICLIVPEVKGIPNKEHERHVEHYETLLREKGVTGIKKIMTFHEFKTEYGTFELKNRLVDLFDHFLVDGKISGKVVRKCGSIFYKKRKVPVSIKLQATNLKLSIELSLKKAFFLLSWRSDSHAVEFGNSKMNIKSLVENVFSILKFIEKDFPGKMENVRNLNVYAYRGSSIPIYLSLKNPNEVQVPKLPRSNTKKSQSVRGELTTLFNANVVVKPSGTVTVQRLKQNVPSEPDASETVSDEIITDADIKKENYKEPEPEPEKRTKKRKLAEKTNGTKESKSDASKKKKLESNVTKKRIKLISKKEPSVKGGKVKSKRVR